MISAGEISVGSVRHVCERLKIAQIRPRWRDDDLGFLFASEGVETRPPVPDLAQSKTDGRSEGIYGCRGGLRGVRWRVVRILNTLAASRFEFLLQD